MLEAEADAKLALARLVDSCAGNSEQHKVITAELEAVQCSVKKKSLRANDQQQTVQSAKEDAMGYRLEEIKNLFPQCELRME